MTKLVLIHGWALNSGVWQSFIECLTGMDADLDIECIDLPGYGDALDVNGAGSLESMATYCLSKVSEPAIWVGWSLGGLVAMQAALLAPSLVKGMQLISSSPKFVESDDWPEGVSLASFKQFSEQLANDYERTLTMFLLMQAGGSAGARDLAREAHAAICQRPNPNAKTLMAGIDCLAGADLRDQLSLLSMPIQVVSGLRDRIAKPASAASLANILSAELIELNTGHAPFMTEPNAVAASLLQLIAK